MDSARRQAILDRYARQAARFDRIARRNHPELHHPTPDLPCSVTHPEGQVTEREIVVLNLIADGSSNAEIARTLFISEETVKTHVRKLLWKLQAHNRAHAVGIGIRRGLVPSTLPPP
jgi:DNA-binding NarL/FixJ family response regulator